jgi:hypothetical protein
MEVVMFQATRTMLAATVLGLAAPVAAQAGDWEGPYVGAYGAYLSSGGGEFGLGGQAGYNVDVGGGFYAGAEGDLLYTPSGSHWRASGAARLGYELAPNVLGFGKLGAGQDDTGTNFWLVGAGLEYAFSDSFSARIDGERMQDFGGGGTTLYVAKAGLVWNF